MKINNFLLISFLVVIGITGCSHTPEKLEEYIKHHCEFKDNSNACIDLRKALEIDYDSLFVFDSFTPITCVKEAIGVHDYCGFDDHENSLVCPDSEMCRIIMTKNKKVVYDDEYYYNNYCVKIMYHDFDSIISEGIFDGEKIRAISYINTDSILKLRKSNNIFTISK